MLISLSVIAKGQDENKITKEIKGTIESDGHIMNDSVKFFISVDLDGFAIKGSNGKKYEKRTCDKKNCKIIHLEIVNTNTNRFYSSGNIILSN